jgi:hypothetical protein
LEVPLRIFRVGVEYLIRHDEKVLLDLVSVERKIVRQALGLGGEDGVETSVEMEFSSPTLALGNVGVDAAKR